MRHIAKLSSAVLLISGLLVTQSLGADEQPEFLKFYKGDVELPEGLVELYGKLLNAIENGDQGDICQHCLPSCVSFTIKERPEKSRDFGHDINIPFLKSGFDKYVRSIRKDGEGCYLIRTNSTAMWFIETKSMGWRLYKYFDKPMQ